MRLALNFFGLQNWNNWANIGSNSNTTHSQTDLEVSCKKGKFRKVSTKKWPSLGSNLTCDFGGKLKWCILIIIIIIIIIKQVLENYMNKSIILLTKWKPSLSAK